MNKKLYVLSIFLMLLCLGFSFVLVGCEKWLSISYIEIDSNKLDDYELFILPNSVDIFNLTDDDLEFYWINTNDIDRYVVKLYESSLVITVVDAGMTIALYNQNGFYYILVEKEKIK